MYFGTWLRTEHFKLPKTAPSCAVTFTLSDLKCRTLSTHILEVTEFSRKHRGRKISKVHFTTFFFLPNRELLLKIRLTLFYVPGINLRIYPNIFNHKNKQNYAIRAACSKIYLALI